MRRLLALCLIAVITVSSAACTAPQKTIGGITYQDYGLLDQENRNPKVRYEPNWWNIVIVVVFFEMIIPPIYVFGYHLFKPAGPAPAQPGQVQ